MNDQQQIAPEESVSSWLIPLCVALALLALSLLLIFGFEVFLLIFAGCLLGVFYRSLGTFVQRYTQIGEGASLTIALLSLLAIIVGTGYFMLPSVVVQANELTKTLPEAISTAISKLQELSLYQDLDLNSDPKKYIPKVSSLVGKVSGVLSTTLGFVANLVIIFFFALYFSVEPITYKKGVLLLFPQSIRPRVSEVLSECYRTLQWWLIGKTFSMTLVGVLSFIGLWLLNVPLALILALIAAALAFIPNIGPVLSVLPAALLAFSDSPSKALYVLLLYIGIQAVESYVITPIVQRKTISLPPLLILSSQILFGIFGGVVGIAVATPLTAFLVIIIKRFYVEDALGTAIPEESAESKRASPKYEAILIQ